MNIKIAGKWMFIPLKMVLIGGIDPYPCLMSALGFSYWKIWKSAGMSNWFIPVLFGA